MVQALLDGGADTTQGTVTMFGAAVMTPQELAWKFNRKEVTMALLQHEQRKEAKQTGTAADSGEDAQRKDDL